MRLIIIIISIMIIKRFPAHDELGTCRTSLVSPEQPVLSLYEAYMRLISSANNAAARDSMQAEKQCLLR